MKKLPNDCSYSELWVSPENWKTTKSKSSLLKNWYIQCYFFDPTFKEKYPNGYPFRKKLNKFKTLDERKAAALFFLEEIPKLFEQKGYNPITKKFFYNIEENTNSDVGPETLFIEALEFAKSKLVIEKTTASDLKYVMNHFIDSILQLRYDTLKISEVKRKHIRFIIENLEKNNGAFSAHKFNKYRGYIQMLFSELLEFEAVETNIINDIRKRVQEKKAREVLTDEQRILVKNHLSNNHPQFWVFTQLFFHSGGRITELLRLKVDEVDLQNQLYKTLIKKGKQNIWVKRPIKDIAFPIWRKLIFGANIKDFVFSVGLVPGPESIRRDQINRRWKKHVKDKLGITADFYSLKHSNLDEVSELLSLEDAALLAGHTNTNMVRQVYAVGEKNRQIERVKKINNKFA
jgi:integrase